MSTVGVPVLFLLFLQYERKVGLLAAILWPWFFCEGFLLPSSQNKRRIIVRSIDRTVGISVGSSPAALVGVGRRTIDKVSSLVSSVFVFG